MPWPGQRRTYQQVAAACEAEAQAQGWFAAPSGYAVLTVPVPAVDPAPIPRWAYGPAFLDCGVRFATGPLAQTGYIPAFYGDARIGHVPGGFAIGRGAVGHLRPYHGRLTPQPAFPFQIGAEIGAAVVGDKETWP